MNPYAPTNGVDISEVKLKDGDLLLHNNHKDHFAYLEGFLATKLKPH